MHMSDALLSPAVGVSLWAVAGGLIGHASRRLRSSFDEARVPLMGVLGAFVFAAQMINFAVPGTGSSGHLSGGLLLAVCLGPWRGFLAIASVLVVQALFFADGGLLALGANIVNLGFFACFLVYPLVWRPLAAGRSGGRFVLGTMLSAVLVLQAGAFGVVLETVLSGISDLPFTTFVWFMQPIHLAIGLVEGLVTTGILLFVRGVRPELLAAAESASPGIAGPGPRGALAAFLGAAVVIGGVLSWVASDHPDGLEWSIAQTVDRSVDRAGGTEELAVRDDGLRGTLARLQERLALLPDYGFRADGDAPAPGGDRAGTSLSGIVGVVLVLLAATGLGHLARRRAGGEPS